MPRHPPTSKLKFPSAPAIRRPIEAKDLFHIKLVGDPRLSPDGAHVAYVVTELDEERDVYLAAIWIASTGSSDRIKLTSGSHRDTDPRWSPDGKQIVFVSNRPSAFAASTDSSDRDDTPKKIPDDATTPDKPINQLWIISPGGGEASQLTRRDQGATSPEWSPDGRDIAFLSSTEQSQEDADSSPVKPIADERIITRIAYRHDGHGFVSNRTDQIWIVGPAGGTPRQLTHGDAAASQITWSPDGSRIAFVSNRTPDRDTDNVSALYVVPANGGETRPLLEANAHVMDPVWSPDGTRIAVLGHLNPAAGGAMNSHLMTVTMAGDAPESHTNHWDRSFGDRGMSDIFTASDQRPYWLADNETILALASDSGSTRVYSVDLRSRSVTAITGGERRISALSANGHRLVYLSGETDQLFELYQSNRNGRNERRLTNHNEAFLTEVALVPSTDIRAISPTDGQEIQGWVIKPPTFNPGVKYPLILQIHGGPHAMYGVSPFHEMQLMAARGYVVLFTNPRGSAGYGEKFTSCTRGQWGEADSPDVLAVLDALIDQEFVDVNRLGITGGSYGGYLTNWIIGHSDRFRAAVTQRCVSNFYSMYGTSDIGFTFGEYEFDGKPWSDSDLLLKHSPISYVDNITTPLLIIHNENDLRCPIEQAEQLFVSLKRLGRTVEFVRIPGEDHNLSRTGTPSRRLARLHHLIGWFDRHL